MKMKKKLFSLCVHACECNERIYINSGFLNLLTNRKRGILVNGQALNLNSAQVFMQIYGGYNNFLHTLRSTVVVVVVF